MDDFDGEWGHKETTRKDGGNLAIKTAHLT